MITMEDIIQVKSSAELYRLISRENLHLRRGHGRDDALLKQLVLKLNLDPNRQIPKQLESKRISIEEFVQAFFLLTEPFTKMLSLIYLIMQRQQARTASHSIRMRFSFQKISEKLDFDLKHYREWLAVYQKLRGNLTIRLWSLNDIKKLFLPIKTLRDIYGDYGEWIRSYSSPLPNPNIIYKDSRWKPLKKLRDSMEQLRKVACEEADEHTRVTSVLTKKIENTEQEVESDPSKIRLMLSDFWPGFVRLLSQLEKSSPTEKLSRDTVDALKKIEKVLRNVRRTDISGETIVQDLVELLRLPFWKHRWRVYEVWVLFEVIDCLDAYSATLELVGDRLTMEEYKATKVAQFKDADQICYEIWTQLSTIVNNPYKRKQIMPDIRFCKGNASFSQNTLLIIECKQRKQTKHEELEDLIVDYERGAKKSVLNIFVNYDEFPAVSQFSRTKLFSYVNPTNSPAVQSFRKSIKIILMEHGIKPVAPQFDAILFDVSGSMKGRYTDSEIYNACKILLEKNIHSKIFFFSSNLLPVEGLSTSTLRSELERLVSGSTNLDGSLRELHTKHPDIKCIAVVTDGDYDNPLESDELFERVEELILGKNFPPEANN